jgi:hypothetical protein
MDGPGRVLPLAVLAAVWGALTACGPGGPITPEPTGARAPQPVPANAEADPPGEATPERGPAIPPDAVEISLAQEEPLTLVEILPGGGRRGTGPVFLEGIVRVTLTNRWHRTVEIVHMDPANLVFTREDTGEIFSLIHPCEPGLLLGSLVETAPDDAERIRARSVLALAPGETRTLRMGGDWGCGGGPWKPVPAPGRHRVEYRAHPWRPAALTAAPAEGGQSLAERLDAVRRALARPAFWDGAFRSNALEIDFPRPAARRVR